MKNRNIILIGFMGSGKTAVGKCLARRLGWRLVDIDKNIVDQDGRQIKTIFAVDGEQYFRQLETGALAEMVDEQRIGDGKAGRQRTEKQRIDERRISKRTNDRRTTTKRSPGKRTADDGLVVSTGGGIVLRPENRRLLKKLGLVVWLKVKPGEVIKRVGRKKDRPLLNVPDKYATIKMILAARRKVYAQAANIKVETSGLTIKQVGEKIIKAWQKKAR